ncbi:YybH family protein [Cesiribacter andamanensis]|uniref:DUF4440 domain-containing protein n=1 Tax=Cesiribacter andamanensis AMV16 TaxID=1279009 RepID=M7NT69_9BACT|nr:SgcJ/EcaC family oxidoreductase [Cesiribacter andamanensis]EMR01679.1 hypothetical protein ADICEAN_03198 [Cesiribacter andamanensis AMV16]
MNYSPLTDPESIPKVFTQAWNQCDAQTLASLFDEDAEFINVTGLWWHSRASIERAHAYGFSTIFTHSTLTLLKTKVRYLSPAIAVVHARVKLTGQSPIEDILQPGERRTLFTFVVHKLGEHWSCVSAHNTDISYRETHVRDEKGQLQAVDYNRPPAEPEQQAPSPNRKPLRKPL